MDRSKALSYMEQAVEVLKDHADDADDLASVWEHIWSVFWFSLMARMTALSRGRTTLAVEYCVQHWCGMPIVSVSHLNRMYF